MLNHEFLHLSANWNHLEGFKKQKQELLGGTIGLVSVFGLDHDLRVLGSSSTSGSLLSGESAYPSYSSTSFSLFSSLTLSLKNK